MKKINFRSTISDEITNAGIVMTCDEDMNLIISDSDYERLRNEFPAAFDDSYIVTEASL